MAEEPGIFEIITSCRAMRRLKPEPVPEELLLRLIDAGNHAPSGSNAQPARWLIVRDAEQRRRIAELNRAGVMPYLGQRAVDAPLPHQDARRMERLRQAVLWQAEHLQDVPALIFACLQTTGTYPDSFLGGLTAGGSIWPGVQNVLLAARALGLGAAPTTLVFRDRSAVKQVLGLPDSIEPVCMIPVGYPMGRFGPVTRQPVEQTLRWDRWS